MLCDGADKVQWNSVTQESEELKQCLGLVMGYIGDILTHHVGIIETKAVYTKKEEIDATKVELN